MENRAPRRGNFDGNGRQLGDFDSFDAWLLLGPLDGMTDSGDAETTALSFPTAGDSSLDGRLYSGGAQRFASDKGLLGLAA